MNLISVLESDCEVSINQARKARPGDSDGKAFLPRYCSFCEIRNSIWKQPSIHMVVFIVFQIIIAIRIPSDNILVCIKSHICLAK